MKVGFIINSRVPCLKAIGKGMPPWGMLLGWDDAGSTMSFMRFRWLARFQPRGIRYELYRPGSFYNVVVFIKSMGTLCMELLHRLRLAGTTVVFEANVDYYTPWNGAVPMREMVPTASQKKAAEEITRASDAVIASSSHLTGICSQMNSRCYWVPDNILPELCPQVPCWKKIGDGRLQVWWSGMANKLFDLLAAQESLSRFRNRIHLHLVTNDFNAEKIKWHPELRRQFETFLKRIPHTFHRFKSITHLLKLYSLGGIVISPRFLEIPYNLGHSEWKITLGMACGLPALASPQPSYQDVARRAQPDAIRICRTQEDWDEALEWACLRMQQPSESAQTVVRRHYLSPLVAKHHLGILRRTLYQKSQN
ncbi:MAG: hypothetical protein C5B47_03430 [Verrucomicrobia bacterium]|nr:MAG: hypothetical protein C5B47_03430 [Verrucomicrobiota bacterium]